MRLMEDLLWQNARETLDQLRRRDISAVELMNAHYDQIEAINPGINAIVNLLDRDLALAAAREADDRLASGATPGVLHGMPMAPKDALDVVGFPTTQGFVPFAQRMARADSALVARQRAAGALMIGKTNLPEFALGSHTFNRLFGVTRNPYNHSVSAGGSSGGAAAALASGMLSIADGSDMGGSLRNPAAFCNVVGFRPSIGRLPDERGFGWLGRLATAGPMARNVADAALLFSVQAGRFATDPLTLDDPPEQFAEVPQLDCRGMTIAVAEALDGVPVEREVRGIIGAAGRTFESLGAAVEPLTPDFSEAMAVFQTLRAANLAVTGRLLEEAVPNWREHAKDTAIWNIEQGYALSAEDIINAELTRTRLYREYCQLLERYDALVLPSAQVLPFPVDVEWVTEIEGSRWRPIWIG